MVKVDQAKCIGCGLCVSLCPAVFELKEGKSYVKNEKAKAKCIKDAAKSCPVGAITV